MTAAQIVFSAVLPAVKACKGLILNL